MHMETSYIVTADTEESIAKIASLWGYEFAEIDNCSFEVEGEDSQILDTMERVMKVVHRMETECDKANFRILGFGETDYDYTLFVIDYSGTEPMIKAHLSGPDIDEEEYESFTNADYDEIPGLLESDPYMTFEQAIDDENYEGDYPLGGFVNMTYEEWHSSVIEK